MGDWRKRYNAEVCDLYNRPNIVHEIKRRRLEWADDTLRKPEVLGKPFLLKNPEMKRHLGRPWMHLENCVKRDATRFYPDEDNNYLLIKLDLVKIKSLSLGSFTKYKHNIINKKLQIIGIFILRSIKNER